MESTSKNLLRLGAFLILAAVAYKTVVSEKVEMGAGDANFKASDPGELVAPPVPKAPQETSKESIVFTCGTYIEALEFFAKTDTKRTENVRYSCANNDDAGFYIQTHPQVGYSEGANPGVATRLRCIKEDGQDLFEMRVDTGVSPQTNTMGNESFKYTAFVEGVDVVPSGDVSRYRYYKARCIAMGDTEKNTIRAYLKSS